MTRHRPALLVALLALGALAALPSAAGASSKTVWLCKPGLKDNPCEPGFATTRFSPGATRLGIDRPKAPKDTGVDCFYVYPTVSDQKTPIATRRIDPEERSIALYQAARYSSVCRVFAPMYRQSTLATIDGGPPPSAAERALGPGDVRAALKDYLRRYNNGRGIVFIGHSQGSFVLRSVLRSEVDRKPSVRKLLLSAILLGGNVTVRKGQDAGGDFQRIPACRSATQLRCVVAFSTFGANPPADALFGRAGGDREILCTNPAALAGGASKLDAIFPSVPFAPGTIIGGATLGVGFTLPSASTPWISIPGAYRGQCVSANGANVLRITPRGGAPTLNAVPTASWGLHLVDANIALGNLTRLVASETAAFATTRRTSGGSRRF